MKKAFTAATVLLAAALCLSVALAAGAGADDPLVSLSYLTNTFTAAVEAAAGTQMDTSDEVLRQDMQLQLSDLTSAVLTATGQDISEAAQELTLNQGDGVSGSCGLLAVPLAGEITLSITAGTVIDASTGAEVSSGTTLTANHRYLVAENSNAVFIAATPTAILSCQGSYAVRRDASSIDYFGIARALRSLDLFRGTGSGIGEGFDLHLAPTRAEALVVFIRILSEEDAALACTDSHPFTDVPAWLDRYVAWAYARSYTNGVAPDRFGTQQAVTAVEFEEFLLRALGYSTAGIDDYRTSLERAVVCGVLTDAECRALKDGTFLRAHVAYLCYYTLDAQIAKSDFTLGQYLVQQGSFSSEQLDLAKTCLRSDRLR